MDNCILSIASLLMFIRCNSKYPGYLSMSGGIKNNVVAECPLLTIDLTNTIIVVEIGLNYVPLASCTPPNFISVGSSSQSNSNEGLQLMIVAKCIVSPQKQKQELARELKLRPRPRQVEVRFQSRRTRHIVW